MARFLGNIVLWLLVLCIFRRFVKIMAVNICINAYFMCHWAREAVKRRWAAFCDFLWTRIWKAFACWLVHIQVAMCVRISILSLYKPIFVDIYFFLRSFWRLLPTKYIALRQWSWRCSGCIGERREWRWVHCSRQWHTSINICGYVSQVKWQ